MQEMFMMGQSIMVVGGGGGGYCYCWVEEDYYYDWRFGCCVGFL